MRAALPDELLALMVGDAAARSGVEAAAVEVLRADAVTWSDGSLGCPEPGMFYTQALVDGYWVELRVGDDVYDFRVDARGAYRLCPPGDGGPPVLDHTI